MSMLKYTIPTIDTAWFICPEDDAIGADDAGYAQYVEELDEGKLALQADKRPVRWKLTPLSPMLIQKIAQKEHVSSDDVLSDVLKDPDMSRSVAQLCVVGVEGDRVEGWPEPLVVRREGRRHLSDEAILAWSSIACLWACIAAIRLWGRTAQLPLSSPSPSESPNGATSTLRIAAAASTTATEPTSVTRRRVSGRKRPGR
jgi:hypothetical protein